MHHSSPGGIAGTGGGSTDIRRSPYGIANRLLVAGGGGGGGYQNNGGNGGGLIGQDGGFFPSIAASGGKGGTQSGGGIAGDGNGTCVGKNSAGALFQGGTGDGDGAGGGGGGGGYYGGGGACFAGGGGGSSFTAVGSSSITHTQGYQNGNGSASFLLLMGATYTSIACPGDSSTVTVVATGGTAPYTGTGTFKVAAGTYTYTVTDANAVKIDATITITEPPALVATVSSQTNIACYGDKTGAATISVTGGKGKYTYDWEPGTPTGDSTASISGLIAGTYSVTVSDSNGCVTSKTVKIEQPAAPLAASIASYKNVSCNGGTDGSATVSVTGGTGSYLYDWTPGTPTGDGTSSVSGLSAGTYTATIKDDNSCVFTQTVTLTQPAAIKHTQTLSICAGETVHVGIHTYSTSGTYTDVLEAMNGCDSTETTELTVLPAINLNTSTTGTTITAAATGATYQWIDCNKGNAIISGETNQSYTAIQNGSYAVIITENKCVDTSACVPILNVGIGTLAADNLQLSVTPNPANAAINIVLSNAAASALKNKTSLKIFNALGKVVYAAPLTSDHVQVDVGSYNSGLYFIQVTSGNNVITKQIIKE